MITATRQTRYSIERLPNAYIRIVDRQSGLSGLYTANGHHQHGDLRLFAETVRRLIG